MSKKRQTGAIGDGFTVRSLSLTLRDRHRIEPHAHPWAQLVYASSGLMRVATPTAAWLVPSTQAIWVPAGELHAIEMRGTTSMRTLYVAPALAARLAGNSRALVVSPLLRELILHIVRLGMIGGEAADERLAHLLIDLLGSAGTSPLSLPMPRDRRALRLAQRLLDDAEDRRPLHKLATTAGASLRTLQRIFAAETGLSLDAWRIRARLQNGIVLLTGGASVTETALATGYSAPSAFITAFRRTFGETPARYRSAARMPQPDRPLRPREARPRRGS